MSHTPSPTGPGANTATEAESVVLGALVAGHAPAYLLGAVSPEDFGTEHHRLIMQAALRIHGRGDPVGAPLILDELHRLGKSEFVRAAYLGELLNFFPGSGTDLHAYAATVRRVAAERRLRRSLRALSEESDLELEELLSRTGQVIEAESDRVGGTTHFLDDVLVEDLEKPRHLIENLMPIGGLIVLFGPPGAGKTFVAMDWALCVASGFRWLDRPVERGTVAYVLAEGGASVGARVRAWKHNRQFVGRAGVWFHREPIALMDPGKVAIFLAELNRQVPAPVALLIFDTLARCMIGGDENSTTDMSALVASVDRIRTQTGAAVLLLHHTNKAGELERGNTALRGAADTMISVRLEDEVLTLGCEKQKESTPFDRIRLALQPVLDSCAVVSLTDRLRLAETSLHDRELQVLRALSDSLTADGLSTTAWMECCERISRASFYRARKILVTEGYVESRRAGTGSRYTLTDRGQEALTGPQGIKSQGSLREVSETPGTSQLEVSPPGGPLCNRGPGDTAETCAETGDPEGEFELEWEGLQTRAGDG